MNGKQVDGKGLANAVTGGGEGSHELAEEESLILTGPVVAIRPGRHGGMANARGAGGAGRGELIMTGPAVPIRLPGGTGMCNSHGPAKAKTGEQIMIGPAVPIRSRCGRGISNARQQVSPSTVDAELLIELANALSRLLRENPEIAEGINLANDYQDQPRVPAGQSGGGQWAKMEMAPSAALLSGRDGRISSAKSVPQGAAPLKPKDAVAERMMQIDPPIASDPISEALDLLSLASIPSLLKSIPSLVAVSAEGSSALIRKLAAVAAGKAVDFTEEESGLLAKILSRIKKAPSQSPEIAPEEIEGKTRSEIRGLAKQKGLVPTGDAAEPDFPRKWNDPVTGEQRLRLDRGHIDSKTGQPYDNPNAASDHVHAYDPNGNDLEVHSDRHIPTTGE